MSLEWGGLQATPFPGSGLPGGQTCTENQRPANEPSLAAMMAKAIDLLDDPHSRRGRDRRGFFLQVEGASIDKQDHVENPCQQIGETIAFDRIPVRSFRSRAMSRPAGRARSAPC